MNDLRRQHRAIDLQRPMVDGRRLYQSVCACGRRAAVGSRAFTEKDQKAHRFEQVAKAARERATVRPYESGSHKCCCGNPQCTDFEDRMAAWGIPLDEIATAEYTIPLD